MREVIWGMAIVVSGITAHHILQMKNKTIWACLKSLIPSIMIRNTVQPNKPSGPDSYWGDKAIPVPPDEFGFKSRSDISSGHHNYK